MRLVNQYNLSNIITGAASLVLRAIINNIFLCVRTLVNHDWDIEWFAIMLVIGVMQMNTFNFMRCQEWWVRVMRRIHNFVCFVLSRSAMKNSIFKDINHILVFKVKHRHILIMHLSTFIFKLNLRSQAQRIRKHFLLLKKFWRYHSGRVNVLLINSHIVYSISVLGSLCVSHIHISNYSLTLFVL